MKLKTNQRQNKMMRMALRQDVKRNVFDSTARRTSFSASEMNKGQRAITEYELLLQETHPAFCTKLLHRGPEIPPMELKVCILARSFLGIKESASILSLSSSSIESHRWHARKKL